MSLTLYLLLTLHMSLTVYMSLTLDVHISDALFSMYNVQMDWECLFKIGHMFTSLRTTQTEVLL